VQFFECQSIDAVFYLIADYSSRCFDATWKRMLIPEVVLAIIYPIGKILSVKARRCSGCRLGDDVIVAHQSSDLGGPLALLWLLRRFRRRVNVRFLTARYKPRAYFWDV
jgi:hypothetical protein